MAGDPKREQLESQLAHSEHIASLGRLCAGVAHEINNPLASILSNVEVAEERVRAATANGDRIPEGVLEALADSRKAALRIRATVRDLSIFMRVDDGTRTPVDLHAVAEAAIQIAWNELRHRTTLCRDYGPTPYVDANQARCVQVVLNLLVNAIHSIPEGPSDNEIRIRIATQDDWALLEVTDTGQGIPKADLPHVFEPFFTTREGHSAGLGLSICHVFVRGWGGGIEVDSTEGKGTTFRVLLPPSKEPGMRTTRTAPAPAVPVTPVAAPRARVLVIDDDHDVLRAVQRGLSGQHDVVAVDDAQRSLRMLKDGERFDVILCDVMMPRMSGVDFYEAIQEISPELVKSIVFITGGAFTPRTVEFLTRVRFVEKPLTLGAMRQLIASALASNSRAG